MGKGEKAVWALLVFALIYFGGHVIVAGMRGHLAPQQVTTGLQTTTQVLAPTTTADEWPDCKAACHSPEAERAVFAAQGEAGPGLTCWAEDNESQPGGFEVICQRLR